MRAVLLVATAAGLYAAAAPPLSVDVVAPLVILPLLLALRGRTGPAAFALGALFGVLAAACVTWWAPGMLSRYFGVPLPVAVLGALVMYALCVGLPFGLFGAGAARLLAAGGAAASIGVPALWVAAELARTYLFTGLPWEFLGETLHRRLALIQIADVTGAWGLSFLCASSSVALVQLLGPRALRRPPGVAWLVVVAALWSAAALYGRFRLAEWSAAAPAELPVALVQANRAPATRVSPVTTAFTMQSYLRLTRARLGTAHPELIVWPENTASYLLSEDPESLAVLRRLSAETGATVLVGAPRRDRATGERHNTAYAVDRAGIAGFYDKVHLVPFAEYAPLGLRALAGPAAVLVAGRDVRPVPDPHGSLGVLICYEILYPQLARRLVAAGARVLVNIANDTWMDPVGTGAAAQMTSMAVFRAVETRRWVTRTTTTGETAVIDPAGRVRVRLGVGAADVVHARVGLSTAITPYVRVGDAFAWMCTAAAFLALAVARRS